VKKYLAFSIASILALGAPSIAKAQFYISADIGGVPTVSSATLENFDEATPSILTFSGNAALVTGHGAYSVPPYFSGSTAAYFGESPANGPDSSQYVAVWDSGSATLSFSTPQQYLGLLWGSVDASTTLNILSFYDSANNVIGTVSGADILALTGGSSGDDGPNGTVYVNITSATPFSSAVASATGIAFEFDDVAYAPVPEPASLSLLAFGMFRITLLRRNQC